MTNQIPITQITEPHQALKILQKLWELQVRLTTGHLQMVGWGMMQWRSKQMHFEASEPFLHLFLIWIFRHVDFKVFHLLEPIPLFPGDKKDWDEAGTLCRQGFTTIKRTGMLIVQAVQ